MNAGGKEANEEVREREIVGKTKGENKTMMNKWPMEQIWGASFGMRDMAFFTKFVTSSPNPHSNRPMKTFPSAKVNSISAVK